MHVSQAASTWCFWCKSKYLFTEHWQYQRRWLWRKEAAEKAHTHTHTWQWTGYLRGDCSAPVVWESTSGESDMVHTPHRHCGEKAALSPQTALWGSQRPSTLLLGLELVGLRRILTSPAVDYFCLYTPTQRKNPFHQDADLWPLKIFSALFSSVHLHIESKRIQKSIFQ